MGKSGPRELAEYHRKIMEREQKMTNRELIEEGVDLNRGAEKVASILGNGAQAQTTAQTSSTPRRKRSDAGTTRAKPAEPAPAGKLSESQWAQIRVYFERVEQSTIAVLTVQTAHNQLMAEAHDFIDSLKAH
jgi:hypothetical protein